MRLQKLTEMENKTYTLEEIKESARTAADELCSKAGLGAGDVLVVGCSSSEITGGVIGHASSPEVADAVYTGITEVTEALGIYVAAQCCEHLNRAIIIEKELYRELPYAERVNVRPMPKAGGSFATAAYNNMKEAVAVEFIKADAGLDIGSTLIGMHLKHVAVPLRLELKRIGHAYVTAARVRSKFIGGSRAVYEDGLL